MNLVNFPIKVYIASLFIIHLLLIFYNNAGVLEGFEVGPVYPGIIAGQMYNITKLRQHMQPVRDFQLAYNVHIFIINYHFLLFV